MSLGLARPAELPVCGEPAGAQIDVGGDGGVAAAGALAARAGGDLRACAAWLRREPGCSALTFRAERGGGAGDGAGAAAAARGTCALHDRFAPGFAEGPAAGAAYLRKTVAGRDACAARGAAAALAAGWAEVRARELGALLALWLLLGFLGPPSLRLAARLLGLARCLGPLAGGARRAAAAGSPGGGASTPPAGRRRRPPSEWSKTHTV